MHGGICSHCVQHAAWTTSILEMSTNHDSKMKGEELLLQGQKVWGHYKIQWFCSFPEGFSTRTFWKENPFDDQAPPTTGRQPSWRELPQFYLLQTYTSLCNATYMMQGRVRCMRQWPDFLPLASRTVNNIILDSGKHCPCVSCMVRAEEDTSLNQASCFSHSKVSWQNGLVRENNLFILNIKHLISRLIPCHGTAGWKISLIFLSMWEQTWEHPVGFLTVCVCVCAHSHVAVCAHVCASESRERMASSLPLYLIPWRQGLLSWHPHQWGVTSSHSHGQLRPCWGPKLGSSHLYSKRPKPPSHFLTPIGFPSPSKCPGLIRLRKACAAQLQRKHLHFLSWS